MNATLMARKQRYSSCCAVLACYAVVTECNQAARRKGGARLYNMRSTARQAQCAATGPGERFSFPRRNADWNPRGRVIPSKEILLWATPSEPPRALQASECSELLDPTRTSYVILAQRQPGKFDPRTLHATHMPTQKYQRAAYETKRRKHRPPASSSSRFARAATRKPCFHPTFNDLSRGRNPCPRRAARTPSPWMARTQFPRRELRARPQIGYCRREAPSGSRRLDYHADPERLPRPSCASGPSLPFPSLPFPLLKFFDLTKK